MDRRLILIASLAIAAGCAAVVAVGMHDRATRRAARLAAIESDLAESDEAAARAGAAFTVGAPADDVPADPGAATPEPPADADAIVAAAAEPAREYHRHKKKRKPQLSRDARRLSDSPGPRRKQAAARLAGAEAGEAPAAARQALSFVGIDPDAEAVWADAINDPSRTAHERQDLIEDLNEDGFPDPKHVTAADLPLIESRLALIEQFAPDAMDDVNAAAFAEAYKDLVNMYGRAVSEAEEP